MLAALPALPLFNRGFGALWQVPRFSGYTPFVIQEICRAQGDPLRYSGKGCLPALDDLALARHNYGRADLLRG